MNIELRHLRYFVAVAEELHFGRAAARLAISQPPLSQQIQTLEEQVGARLLARTNRSVSLTAAGEQFLHDARQILTQVEAAAPRAARLHAGETGELRLGMTASAPFIKIVSDALLLYRQGLRMEAQTRIEAAATFLAESEFAYLEYRAASGTLAEGASVRQEHVAFSPEASDVSGGGDFLLRTDIQRMEQAGAYRAAVTVAWQHGGRQHQQVYQRRVGVYEGQ